MSTSFNKLRIKGPLLKVKLLDVSSKYGGTSIIKPDMVKEGDRTATQEAIVLEVGPQAFELFGTGDQKGKHWCKVGDHILMKRHDSMKQQDCTCEEDMCIRIIFDENVVGVFENVD